MPSILDINNANTLDMSDPNIQKAFDLALEFSTHCKKSNFNVTFIICGVAFDYAAIEAHAKKEGYTEGKAFERGRISQLLGLI